MKLGHAFSVYGPTVWNSLPSELRLINCQYTFRRLLKSHLFQLAYKQYNQYFINYCNAPLFLSTVDVNGALQIVATIIVKHAATVLFMPTENLSKHVMIA